MTDSNRYTLLEAALTAAGKPCCASEAHGTWSGLLSADAEVPAAKGLDALAEDLSGRHDDTTRVLASFFAETRRALEDEQLSFDLLLPEDEAPLTERAEALARWCQGFLYGLGLGGNRPWSQQALEILRDFQAISQLDPKAEGKEDEQAFTELVEYIRVGTQLLFTESALARAKGESHGS